MIPRHLSFKRRESQKELLPLLRPFLLLLFVLGIWYTKSVLTAAISNTKIAQSSPFATVQKSPHSLFSFHTAEDGLECLDVRNATDQCAFVKQYCAEDVIGIFNYIEFYYCVLPDLRIVPIVIMVVWLIIVFTTIGITASDFLCTNLSTIANILGMSESFAGVTLLALGNGSPDVFSTYAAMKVGSGSLAIGELIGAASFITSVVGGSMAIICPFVVHGGSFIRDLAFFTISIGFAMYCLKDARITLWESAAMVGLYIVYVCFVVAWYWWLARVEHLESLRQVTTDHQTANHASTNISNDSLPSYHSDVINSGGIIEEEEEVPLLAGEEGDEHTSTVHNEIERAIDRYNFRGQSEEIGHTIRPRYSESPTSITSSTPIRPSLMSALEFQSAVERGRKMHHQLDEEVVSKHFKRYRSSSQSGPVHSTEYRKDRIGHHKHSNSTISHKTHNRHKASAHVISSSNKTKKHSRQGSVDPDLAYYSDSSTRSILSPGVRSGHPFVSRNPSTNPSGANERVASSLYSSDTLYTVRRNSPNRPPLSIVTGGRHRSDSSLTGSSFLTPSSPRRSRRYAGSRSARSPSPYDRFLAFQPASAFVQEHHESQLPVGASRLHTDDLVNAAPDRQLEAQTLLSPLLPSTALPQQLTIPAQSSSTDLHSDVSMDDTSFSTIDKNPWPFGWLPSPSELKQTLFPTLELLEEKTLLNKFISIVAVPSVFCLTVTVPVVEIEHAESEPEVTICSVPELHIEEADSDHRSEDISIKECSESSGGKYKGWCRWLLAIQCICSPMVMYYVNMYDDVELSKHLIWMFLIGLAMMAAILYFTESRDPPLKLLPILSFLGFFVSISWVSAIAVEAVGVLKAFGVMFGISDAILGLTVFALGNSLGDFVSNVTIARMGYPMMAISACFGSPMLNILIGIGVSGLIILPGITDYEDDDAYELDISPTLVVSASTLFLNLLVYLSLVPLSGWRMTRLIGIVSVSLWCAGTIVNVLLEVLEGRNTP
ncbi:Sodium/calcium exchanger protein-domain-containing protein [Lipomyces oligophaga]|uniref:Sodium/calcium exchanger protein-domain-containing protein n=1 Tax=Lipomyces oligophaga TaxID=45792 RepID=UPI0034CD316B